MSRAESPRQEPEKISKNVVRLLVVIVIALAAIAIYANVQKLRRNKIETVTVLPLTPAPKSR